MLFRSFVKYAGLITVGALLVSCGPEEGKDSAAAQAGPRATPVDVVVLHSQRVSLIEEMPGRTVAFRETDVRPQVDGIIEKRMFEEGALVEQGQPLYQIDSAVYQAELDAARADLAREQANLKHATQIRDRYQKLVKTQTSSQQQYDNAVADYAQAVAAVAAAKARVEQASINMEHTQIKARITGQIGASAFNEGSLVTAGQGNALTTVTQLDPIYVDVTQAGGRLLQIKQAIKSGRVQGFEDGQIDVSLVVDATGQTYAHKGSLKFSDVTVNETTGTVRLRAVFPNPNGDLLPGMFVRGRVEQGELDKAMLVPQKAVMRQPDGTAFAYVVVADKVEIRPLVIEQAQGQDWVVSSGLEDGAQLVVNGLQRIGPGSPVVAQPLDAAPATN